MSDVENPVIVLTPEQDNLFLEWQEVMLEATSRCRAHCDTASHSPRKIAGAVLKRSLLDGGADVKSVVTKSLLEDGADIRNVRGGVSVDTARKIAACFKSCPGYLNGTCYYSPNHNEAALATEPEEVIPQKTLEELMHELKGLYIRETMAYGIFKEARERLVRGEVARWEARQAIQRVMAEIKALTEPEEHTPSTE